MTKPVTRGEFYAGLDKFRGELKADFATKAELANHPTKADLKAELANHPTKADLKAELANYPTKADLKAELANFATKGDLDLAVGALVARMDDHATTLRVDLNVDIARHIRSIMESFETKIGAVDDKYRDLPPRVTRLEALTATNRRRR